MRAIKKLCLIAVTLSLAVSVGGCQFYSKLKARDHLNKGVQAYTAKKYDSATEEFLAAIELDETLVDAYLYLATTYRAQFVPLAVSPDNLKKGQLAITTFERVLELEEGNSTAMANIADLYRNMNEPDRAKEWYRKRMEYEEDKSEPLYGIGSIDYNLADEKTGNDGENVENLSEEEIAEVNQFIEEGIESLKQALVHRPEYTDAMEYLNLLYREKSEIAKDDEERRQWQREADKLALEALEMKRKLQREAERARREVFKKSGSDSEE